MSRSYKKPIWKDKANKKVKRSSSRAVRASEEVGNGSSYKKVFNSWDIHDWAFFDLKNPKARRK